MLKIVINIPEEVGAVITTDSGVNLETYLKQEIFEAILKKYKESVKLIEEAEAKEEITTAVAKAKAAMTIKVTTII
jgi:hypothetical protein